MFVLCKIKFLFKVDLERFFISMNILKIILFIILPKILINYYYRYYFRHLEFFKFLFSSGFYFQDI